MPVIPPPTVLAGSHHWRCPAPSEESGREDGDGFRTRPKLRGSSEQCGPKLTSSATWLTANDSSARPSRTILRVREGQKLAPQTIAQDEWTAALIRQGLGHRRIAALSVHDCDRFLAAVAEGQFGGLLARS